MPKWGLTKAQIDDRPWGIPPHLLAPTKTITDQVHGDVFLNKLETRLVDSPPMQRLRGVRQLGTTHLVYPGATHSRLSHGLGTLRAAQDLLDAVIANRSGPRPADDLFLEWSTHQPDNGISEFDYHLARVTVVMRLGSLLHDFCHVPYGHTVEDDLKVLVPHDRNPYRFRALWAQLPTDLRELFESRQELMDHLLPLILSKDLDKGDNCSVEGLQYPFIADIVGNTICADLIDYLHRDHHNTGLPIALGYRFTNDFYVSRAQRVHWPKRMVIRITRGSQRRVDVVTELLKYLRFRYELSERVLNHHAKLAADAMIGKLLEIWSDELWIQHARRYEPELVDLLAERELDKLKEDFQNRDAPEPDPTAGLFHQPTDTRRTLATAVLEHVRLDLEGEFIRRSDDGLLEYLRDWGAAEEASPRQRVVGELATYVLNRSLFKLIGLANEPADRAHAEKLHREFGDPDKRRKVEEEALAFVGRTKGWHALLWVPGASMRLKVAEVLIDDGGRVMQLDKADFPGVNEIYRNHENLWAIYAFAHPDLLADRDGHLDGDNETVEALLAFLTDRMGVHMKPPKVPGGTARSVSATVQLAVKLMVRDEKLKPDAAVEFFEVAAKAARGTELGGAGAVTFADLKERVRLWAEEMGLVPEDESR